MTAPKHIVVVVLDDVGVDKLGCYGHPTAGPTPAMDAMAANGVRFTRAYANPTCSPTRAAMLTGRYGSRTGIDTGLPHYNPSTNPNGPYAPSDELPWIARELQRGDVVSYVAGKWHLTHVGVDDFHRHPIRTGFTWHRGHLANIVGDQTTYSWPKNVAEAAGWSEATCTNYVTQDNAAQALNALVAAGQANARSFTWLSFTASHPPWTMVPPAGWYTPVGGEQTPATLQQYALEAVDRYLQWLAQTWNNIAPAEFAQTLWLVVGDNGTPAAAIEPPTQAHQHKAEVFEGGCRVPLIAFGAGVEEPGRVCDHLVGPVDLWATLLELFGVTPPAGPTDSVSWAPVLSNPEAQQSRQAVYVRHAEPNGFGSKAWLEHAAVGNRWKLIERAGTVVGLGTPAKALYDLNADPGETVNLWPASTPEATTAVAALQPVLDACGVPFP